MTETLIGPAIAFAALAIGLMQWWISMRVQARQRDAEMIRWGGEVIEMMAELETACSPLAAETRFTVTEIEHLSTRASALVDKGRLFFPNVFRTKGADNDEGIRVKLLDEVLRACYVARHLAIRGTQNDDVLRGHVWQARRAFVTLLQHEMGKSLRKPSKDEEGVRIPLDPSTWESPQRRLRLPLRSA